MSGRLVRPSDDELFRDHEERIRRLEAIAAKNLDPANSFSSIVASTSFVGTYARVPFTLTSDEGNPFVYDEPNGIWTPNYAMTYQWEISGSLTASSDLANPNRVWLYFTKGLQDDFYPGGFYGLSSPCATTGGTGPANVWAFDASGTIDVNPSWPLNLWTVAAHSPGDVTTFVADYTLSGTISFQQV
jgi:hypothetical protein